MPGYISHSIMGEELHNELNRIDGSKVFVSKEELRGYSLGADLSLFSKRIIKDPHDFNTRNFFLAIIKYIKENNLKENGSVMALLYGHIAHYFLDINTHPLIYYIECGCKKVGFLSNHDLIEGYISSYLSKKILNKNISEINAQYFNQIDIDNTEVSKLLNTIYGEIYKDSQITISYKKVLQTLTLLENVIKSGFVSKEMLIMVSQFDIFLEENKLSVNEITNEKNNRFTNPVTGEIHYESFIELYNKSIEMTLNAIEIVNNYLYSNGSFGSLYNVFTDLSYTTGANYKLGNKMIYVRKNKPNPILNR